MNLLKAWNAITARARNRPEELKRKRRSTRRPLVEALEDRRMMAMTAVDPNGRADGDEFPVYDSDDTVRATPTRYPCQCPDQIGAANPVPPGTVSSGGVMYSGNGQFYAGEPLGSDSNIGTVFGHTLVWSNTSTTESGVGAGLHMGNFAGANGGTLYSPGTPMFGNGMAVLQMPQLISAGASTADWWNATYIPPNPDPNLPPPPPPPGTTGGSSYGLDASSLSDGEDLGGSKVIVAEGSNTEVFDLVGVSRTALTYKAEYGALDVFTHILSQGTTAPGQYLLTTADGNTIRFHDFSFTLSDYYSGHTAPSSQNEMGTLISITDAGGNTATFNYDDQATFPSGSVLNPGGLYTDQLVSVTLTAAGSSPGSNPLDEYDYHYLTGSDPNAGRVDTVTLKRNGAVAEQVHYAYYDGTYGRNGSGEIDYTSPEQFGGKGDLMLAQNEDASGHVLSTSYFRYTNYTGQTGTTPGRLTYMFSSASYNRLAAAVGNPLTATISDAAPYADLALQAPGYPTSQGITQVKLQGAGCSVCNAGLGTYTYSYDRSSADPWTTDVNLWTTKTTETRPDSSTATAYSNSIGETLVLDVADPTQTRHWFTAYHYDADGRVVETDNPSAIQSVTPNDDGTINVVLNQSSGLIELTDYYGSTTAIVDVTNTTTPTSTAGVSPGGAGGYVEDTKIKHGAAATPILESFTQYVVVKSGLVNVAEVANTSVYSLADNCPAGTDPATISAGREETQHTYVLFPGLAWVQQETTKLPDVSTAADQLTGGANDQITTEFDTYGHPVWQQDARGFITYQGFDQATGAIIQTIQDFNPNDSVARSKILHQADLNLLPNTWTAPSGNASLNLDTVIVIDLLARPVIEVDPKGNATFNVFIDYIDAAHTGVHEVRSYAGWTYVGNASSYAAYAAAANYQRDANTTPPPVQVRIDNMGLPAALTYNGGTYPLTYNNYAGSFSDTLTMTQVVPGANTQITLSGVTLPMGGEPVANIQSLSRAIASQAGQIVETDDYYNLSGLAFTTGVSPSSPYSPDATLFLQTDPLNSSTPNLRGVQWLPGADPATANYYATTYAYGDTGRVDRVVNANGVIRRIWRDFLGRVTSAWIGTVDGDSPTFDNWSPSNANGGNMVELSANVYDNGGVGDSNLTETVEFPAGSGDTSATAVANFRVNEMAYDWQDQLVSTKFAAMVTFVADTGQGQPGGTIAVEGIAGGWLVDNPNAEGASGDTTQRPITYDVLDNLGEITSEYTFFGNGVSPGDIAAYFANTPGAAINYNGKLRSDVAMSYDARGREFQTTEYFVDQGTGVIYQPTNTPNVKDPHITTTTYDANDNIVQVKDPMLNKSSYFFDGANRLIERRDPNPTDGGVSGGAETYFSYNSDGTLHSVTDANSHTTTRLYDAAGRLTEIDQPPVAYLQSGVYSTSNLTLQTPKIIYTYGNDGFVSTVTDPNGNITTYHQDALGRTTSVVSPQVSVLAAGSTNVGPSNWTPTTLFSYDGDSNTVAVTDANNHITSYAYDMLDQLIQVAPPGTSLPTTNPGQGAIYGFDNLGDRLSVQTADGTTKYDYNTLGQQIKITQPAIDALQSGATSLLSGARPITSFTYDALGDMVRLTDPNGSQAGQTGASYSTTYAYSSFGTLLSKTLPNPTGGSSAGPTTTNVYNADNQLVSVTDPLNNVTSIAYYRNGLQKSVTLPNPSNGSATGGLAYQYTYYAGGQLKTATDPFNNVTTYNYDARNQLSSVQLPNLTNGSNSGGPVISFYHDANGNQTAEKDAQSSPGPNTTYYNFDALNRLSSKSELVAVSLTGSTENDVTATTGYLYDAVGNLTRVTDADGHVIGYDYSPLNQRTTENWFADTNTNSSSTNTISNTYYDGGELHTAVAAAASGGDFSHNSSYTFGYNQLGWLTSVDNNDPLSSGTAGVPRVVLNSKYDLNGNRTALAATVDIGSGAHDDFQNSYTFDRLSRETSVAQQAATTSGHYGVGYKRTAFAYDAASRLSTLTDYTSSTTQAANGAFGYDHTNRLTDLSWTGYGGPLGSSGQFFDKFSWSYDSDSRVANLTNQFYTNENLTYTYDHDSQLTSAAASYGGYGGGVGGGTYSWDGNGDSTVSGRVTGKGNRLLSDGTYRYEYDKSGHLTKRTAIAGGAYTVYAYDNRGRMISVTDKNSSGTTLQTVSLWYDAFNRLIGRIWTQYTNGVAGTPQGTRFVYDGDNAALAFTGNQSLTDRYLWGPAVDQILADERFIPSGSNWMPTTSPGNVYWALGDNEWSVRDWITYGSLVDHVVYDSFGKVYSQSSTSVPFNFGHNGVFYDPATGLEYHSSGGSAGRWYYPAIQRWMSEDPMGLAAGHDPFEYCNDSPTNFIDPSGLQGITPNFRFDSSSDSAPHCSGTSTTPAMPAGDTGGGNPNGLGETFAWWGAFFGALPGAYWSTAADGKQASSLGGTIDAGTNAVNPFGGGTNFGPAYGQNGAYTDGRTVGNVTGFAINTVLTVSGVNGVVSSVQAIRGAGGLLQVGRLALDGGRTIEIVMVSGKAVELTPALAGQLGIATAGVTNLAMTGKKGGGKPVGGSLNSSEPCDEGHHQLPKQFADKFKKAGLEVEDYVIDMEKGAHRLNPNGIHTNNGGNWNKVWKEFFAGFDGGPGPTKNEILTQLQQMRIDFGIE